MPTLPAVSLIRQLDTHRLVPSKYRANGDSVLVDIADDEAHLQALFALDAATNERLRAAHQVLPGIGLEELVFGVPQAAVINAAFCHGHPLGNRFSLPDRGAWYAGFAVQTAQAEVAFHKTIQLAEIHRFEDDVTYDDYLADFSAGLHDLRGLGVKNYLDPESYVDSQALAERLMAAHSLGVVYPSVRHPGGTCVACFRPALVGNVRRDKTYRFVWTGAAEPTITANLNP